MRWGRTYEFAIRRRIRRCVFQEITHRKPDPRPFSLNRLGAVAKALDRTITIWLFLTGDHSAVHDGEGAEPDR